VIHSRLAAVAETSIVLSASIRRGCRDDHPHGAFLHWLGRASSTLW
jgi:hypothetical protein